MRILFVITRADTMGGAQRHVLDLSERLQRDGSSVMVVCGAGSVVTDELQNRNVPYVSIPYFSRSFGRHPIADARTTYKIRSVIRDFDPDLVSTHSVKGGLLGRIAARWCRVPCIYTAHGWSVFNQVGSGVLKIGRSIERGLARWSSRIVNVSHDGHRYSVEMGLPESKLVTIHNGSKEATDQPIAIHGPRDLVNVTMIGRLDEPKDHATLIRAMAGIEGAQLQLVGDGPSQSELVALAESCGSRDRVVFTGRLSDIDGVLAAADVFCLSSKSEGFPRSILEAMRAGLPVVVSDIGGAGEAIQEGSTGYVVPVGDVQAFSSRLSELVDDWRLRRDFGAAGRTAFLEGFTFERMYEKTLQLYDDVLLETRGRR